MLSSVTYQQVHLKQASIFVPSWKRIQNSKFLDKSNGKRFDFELFIRYMDCFGKYPNNFFLLLVYFDKAVMECLPHIRNHHTKESCNQLEVGIVSNPPLLKIQSKRQAWFFSSTFLNNQIRKIQVDYKE